MQEKVIQRLEDLIEDRFSRSQDQQEEKASRGTVRGWINEWTDFCDSLMAGKKKGGAGLTLRFS